MKHFDPIVFDLRQCRREVSQLQALLAANPRLSERKDILPFFRARRQLSAALGCLESHIVRFDRLAFEYDLFGDFACDLAVGDSKGKVYGFIEFEDASPGSIFVRRKGKSTPEWSPRFEHGFSQITDWLCKLDDMERTDEFEDRFGRRPVHYSGLLVVGRSEGFAPRELRRLTWRQERTVVNSRHIRCLTFDQLAGLLDEFLTTYTSGGRKK
jgi:hypothetical protein